MAGFLSQDLCAKSIIIHFEHKQAKYKLNRCVVKLKMLRYRRMDAVNTAIATTATTTTTTLPLHITIPADPISPRVYAGLMAYIQKTMDCRDNPVIFAELRNESLEAFRVALNNINAKAARPISLEEALSIRHAAILTKSAQCERRFDAGITAISKMYESGHDIVSLSNIYRCPPVMLLEKILAVKKVLLTEFTDHSILNDRDSKSLADAALYDDNNYTNKKKRRTEAAENEEKFVNWMRSTGARFKTQEDLVEEQTEEFGGPVATPDILFMEAVSINGVSVKWVEFKDYTGVPDGVLYKSNIRQVKKYTDKWGAGAIVYRQSFVSDTMFPRNITLEWNY